MEKVKKYFLDNNLSETTIKTYMRNLRLLNDGEEFNNLKFLDNIKDVDEFLDKKKLNTKKNYYISIVSALASEPKKKKLYQHYYDKMMDLNKEVKANYSENKKDDKENKNWIEWEEIIKKRDEFIDKINEFKDKKKINSGEYSILLKGLILSLYTFIPPRRNGDFLDMKVRVGKNNDIDFNWLDLKKKEFIFNKYKTAKKEGQLIKEIPDELFDIIKIYLKFKPKSDDYFLLFSDGSKFSINSITYILNSALDKKVGSTLLRHIYLSGKYGEQLNEMKEDSKAMGHSVEMQKDYIKTQ
jgi:integrase